MYMHFDFAGALKGYEDILTAGYGARSRHQSLDRAKNQTKETRYSKSE
jgi:hypothetical protein